MCIMKTVNRAVALVLLVLTISLLQLVEGYTITDNDLVFYELKYSRELPDSSNSTNSTFSTSAQTPCNCSSMQCSCCAGVFIRKLRFDQKVCANVVYRRQQRHREILLDVVLDEKPTARFGISARNPSPFCIPIMLGIPIAMCVQLSNIAVVGNNLNMCMDFNVNMGAAQLLQMNFQCMMVGAQGLQWVDPGGQSILPSGQRRRRPQQSTSTQRKSNLGGEQMNTMENDDDGIDCITYNLKSKNNDNKNKTIEEIQLISIVQENDEQSETSSEIKNIVLK